MILRTVHSTHTSCDSHGMHEKSNKRNACKSQSATSILKSQNEDEMAKSQFIPLKEEPVPVPSVLCKQKEKHRCDAKTPAYTFFNSQTYCKQPDISQIRSSQCEHRRRIYNHFFLSKSSKFGSDLINSINIQITI